MDARAMRALALEIADDVENSQPGSALEKLERLRAELARWAEAQDRIMRPRIAAMAHRDQRTM